jgi:imidazole glycerol-phosphate synthase subunit HisH
MVAVINYGAGNTYNVVQALKALDAKPVLTNNELTIARANKIIFPGVGHAAQAMKFLRKYQLINVLQQVEQPLLGICLGMQLLAKHSNEGDTTALQILNTSIKQFKLKLPVPHIGWNNVKTNNSQPLFAGGIHNADFYFVHGYYMPVNKNTIATCNYEKDFTAATQYKNFYGTQFHPEKSGDAGMQLLKNFLAI